MSIEDTEIDQSKITYHHYEIGFKGENGMKVYKYLIWAEFRDFQPIRELQSHYMTCSVSLTTNGNVVSISSVIVIQCEGI